MLSIVVDSPFVVGFSVVGGVVGVGGVWVVQLFRHSKLSGQLQTGPSGYWYLQSAQVSAVNIKTISCIKSCMRHYALNRAKTCALRNHDFFFKFSILY